MGCVKPSSNPTNNIVLPNVTNFSVSATNFVQGAAAIISIASSSLGSGTFTVNYSLSGANNLVNQIATLVMNGGVGTFSTPVLNGVSSSSGTTVRINSISNTSGGSATPTGGNITTFSDSSGLMTATITGASGGPTTFRGVHVDRSNLGMLSIHGVMWEPWLVTITLYIDNYTGALGTTYFNSHDASSFNGSASYGVAGNGVAISNLSEHGSITITSATPLLAGTFTYTNQDSSVVSGSFSCPAP